MTDQQTSRTNITEALRAEFQRRGWSITMSDNGQSVLDPFPVVAALAAEPLSDAVTAHAAYHREEPCDCEPQPDEPSGWKELIAAGRASGIETAPDEPSTLAALQRMADPLDAVVVTRRAWREARAASASVPPLDEIRAVLDRLAAANAGLELNGIEEEYDRLEPRHYPGDNCGDPNHDTILAAWYRRAEAMLPAAETPEQGRGDESR